MRRKDAERSCLSAAAGLKKLLLKVEDSCSPRSRSRKEARPRCVTGTGGLTHCGVQHQQVRSHSVLEARSRDQEQVTQWWPTVDLATGAPSFVLPPSRSGLSRGCLASGGGLVRTPEGSSQTLLQRALHIAGACSTVRGSSKAQTVRDFEIQCTLEHAGGAVWMVTQRGFEGSFACSEAVIQTETPLEAFLWALYDIEERKKWDSASFRVFTALSLGSAVPGGAFYDCIYCRMPAPPGLRERDVVQERFLLALPEGGFAIVMCSPSPAAERSHALPVGEVAGAKNPVRARTVLSGYLLQPLLGARKGVRITALSQTDFGGSIPTWAQALAKKAGVQRFPEWALRLQRHCERRSAPAAMRAARTRAPLSEACGRVHPRAVRAIAAVDTEAVARPRHSFFVLALLVLIMGNLLAAHF